MPIPSPLPLDDFEHTVQADPEVLGMFYFGSLGRGAAGRFSDLDIFVWLADDVAPRAHDKLLQLFGLLGPTHWLVIEEGKAWLGPEWTQVDIEHAYAEHLQPHYRYAGATVIKDTGGALARMVAACAPEQIVETVESAAAVIHEAISDQLFNARHNARGSVWSAIGGVSEDPAHIQQPLIQTVVDALNGIGSCPSTGESAARTSWVIDQMLKGAIEKQRMKRIRGG